MRAAKLIIRNTGEQLKQMISEEKEKEKDGSDICMHVDKNRSDKMSGGNQIRSDISENKSDII